MRGLALLVLLLDTWSLPEPATYESADRKWRLVTIPGRDETSRSYAELLHYGTRGTWQRAARWDLIDGTFPLHALVANNGTVATFDLRDYRDVVVIYRRDGTLVRRLDLADLLEAEDVDQLSRSTSTIQWAGIHHINEENRVLMLEIAAPRPEKIPVSLDSGEMLVPKRAMFPRPKVEWTAETAPPCLTAQELTERAVATPVPAYPSLGRKARVSGVVILELAIDKDGAVETVTVLEPLPFGISDAAQKAVSAWRFRPQSVKSCARIRMTFDLTRF
jgi:TonB family protein